MGETVTDSNFDQLVSKATGKVLGKEWGIIMGTQTPYISNVGFQTAERINGYSVWKRELTKDGSSIYAQKAFNSEGIEKNLQNVIDFLNEK